MINCAGGGFLGKLVGFFTSAIGVATMNPALIAAGGAIALD